MRKCDFVKSTFQLRSFKLNFKLSEGSRVGCYYFNNQHSTSGSSSEGSSSFNPLLSVFTLNRAWNNNKNNNNNCDINNYIYSKLFLRTRKKWQKLFLSWIYTWMPAKKPPGSSTFLRKGILKIYSKKCAKLFSDLGLVTYSILMY